MEKLKEYLTLNKIQFKHIKGNVVEIEGMTYSLVPPKDMYLLNAKKDRIRGSEHKGFFDQDFNFAYNSTGHDYFIIYFGGRYYRIKQDEEVELEELKYIGKAEAAYETETFLGVHGGYELLSGSRQYEDWTKKAKFLGVGVLGLCEKNTLAGTLKFQQACLKANIVPVIGETVTVKRENGSKYDLKLYVKDDFGWINLLDLNYEINNEGQGYVDEKYMLGKLSGLIAILDPKAIKFEDLFPLDLSIEYYQLDTVEYLSDDKDGEYLENLKKFVNSELKPVTIVDAYYLDKEDAYIKEELAKIGKTFQDKTKNQYFKDNDDYFLELSELTSDFEKLDTLFMKSLQGVAEIARECKFNIETGKRRLPTYDMTEQEREQYGTNENMFYSLIEEGLTRLYPDFGNEELDRIEKEVAVLEFGGFIDYFLITRDIINKASNTKSKSGLNEILCGVGRGSAAGSIVSYLLGIVRVDPIKFKLLFERFLNAGRIGQQEEDDVVVLSMEDGTEKVLNLTDIVEVNRGGKFMFVHASDLLENDEIC